MAAPGHWDSSSPQWVGSHSQPAVAVSGNAQMVVGQTGEALQREEGAPVGTQDTGEGVIDALLLEFYPAEW